MNIIKITPEIVMAANSAEAYQNELLEALEETTELLNDSGLGDIDQWKRDCKHWTSKARALIARVKGE